MPSTPKPDKAIKSRKGMPSPQLVEAEFKRRYNDQFFDPAFRAVQAELDKVVSALRDFYACETHLLEKDLGERTITHRLAVHLEKQFAEWDVDCDYDRLGERTLRLPRASVASTDDHFGKSVYPDIVVHHRSIPENLLAVEVRKAGNHQALEHDQQKLRVMTDPHLWFACRIGVDLTLEKAGVTVSDVYAGGALDQLLSNWLSQRLRETGLSAG